ncbi:MAG TPA: DUF58 domain-containing protein [Syntrophorhabdaceae bacterium]|nr:DUF58 domain-containing protein [Syntrophorhabdaceae bacterium]
MKRMLYIWFRVLSGLRYGIRKRFTPAGKFVLAGIAASAVFGLDTTRSTVYQAFTCLAALIAVAFACNISFRAKLTVLRVLPRFGSAGQTLYYRIRVLNSGNKRLHGLFLLENLLDPRPSFSDFSRGRFGLKPGYKRWRQFITMNQQAVADRQAMPVLMPGREVEVNAGLVPLKRGRIEFESMSIGRADPFGLVNALVTLPPKQHVLILPKRYALPDIKLPGTRAYQQGGIALSTSVADSEEFQSLREYRPGDPLRKIHWKSWAKTGKPIIKEYQDEFFVRHALILDTFIESEYSDLLEEAVSVAASFACTVQTQESLLDLMFVGTEAFCETIGRGQGQIERFLEVLACVRPCTDKPFSVLHRHVVSRRSVISGCVCVLLSWDKSRSDLIHSLHELGLQTLVIVITDPERSNMPALEGVQEKPGWLNLLEIGKIEEGLTKL